MFQRVRRPRCPCLDDMSSRSGAATPAEAAREAAKQVGRFHCDYLFPVDSPFRDQAGILLVAFWGAVRAEVMVRAVDGDDGTIPGLFQGLVAAPPNVSRYL